MTLSTGDILAIVFGSLLGLVIIGYLIYYMMFRKKKTITRQDVEKFIKENPQEGRNIMSMISASSPSTLTDTTQPKEYDDKILTQVTNSTIR